MYLYKNLKERKKRKYIKISIETDQIGKLKENLLLSNQPEIKKMCEIKLCKSFSPLYKFWSTI